MLLWKHYTPSFSKLNHELQYRNIASGTRQYPETAEQWYEELLAAIDSLQKFPNCAAQAPEAIELGQDIRQLFVGKAKRYRILFLVDRGHVAILYVRHSSQAWLE